MSESMYVNLDDLTILFQYKNREGTRRACRRGTIPVHTFKIKGQWVAERETVKAFFRHQREEAARKLKGA